MTLYHRTSEHRAAAILAHGFRDVETITVDQRTERRAGIWLAECYLDADPHRPAGDVIDGSVLIAVTIPAALLSEYDLGGRPQPYCVFCIPAAIVNRCPRRRVTAADEDRLALELDVQLRFGLSPKGARRRIDHWINPDWWRPHRGAPARDRR